MSETHGPNPLKRPLPKGVLRCLGIAQGAPSDVPVPSTGALTLRPGRPGNLPFPPGLLCLRFFLSTVTASKGLLFQISSTATRTGSGCALGMWSGLGAVRGASQRGAQLPTQSGRGGQLSSAHPGAFSCAPGPLAMGGLGAGSPARSKWQQRVLLPALPVPRARPPLSTPIWAGVVVVGLSPKLPNRLENVW